MQPQYKCFLAKESASYTVSQASTEDFLAAMDHFMSMEDSNKAYLQNLREQFLQSLQMAH